MYALAKILLLMEMESGILQVTYSKVKIMNRFLIKMNVFKIVKKE